MTDKVPLYFTQNQWLNMLLHASKKLMTSKCEAYLMPQLDDPLEHLGAAKYISTSDLTKVQIPLSPPL